jgi:hypothetical protein
VIRHAAPRLLAVLAGCCVAVAVLTWATTRLLVGAADGWSFDEARYGARVDALVADLSAIDGVAEVERTTAGTAEAPYLRITLDDGPSRAAARLSVLARCGSARDDWDPHVAPVGGSIRPELVCEISETGAG